MQTSVIISVNKTANVTASNVYVKDVANVGCRDRKLRTRVEELPIYNFSDDKNTAVSTEIVIEAVSIAETIESRISEADVSIIGEVSVLVTKENRASKSMLWKCFELFKIVFVCFCVFYGAAFTIMTFNSDVDIEEVFKLVYRYTGNSGKSKVLEISYAVGIFMGVSLFYNHFSKKKNKKDPTPLEIDIDQYSEDVATYKINNHYR